MGARPSATAALASAAVVAAALLAPVSGGAADAATPGCGPGALSLSGYGSRLYPDTGNGGYRSLHTDVHLVYDAATNRFLTGTHVLLTDRATRCLTSFGLDLERHSANRLAGPDLRVGAVSVDGRPARFRFVSPAFPGDPRGPGDPRPQAHEASQHDPVGGPWHDPLPPACSPELPNVAAPADSQDGRPCPADKLVVTPAAPIPAGAVFRVSVSYTGRPGVHNDGDGTTEGWFRAPDGGFVTTEPVGTEDWMPLNDYPTAKPTYDFYDTVPAGKTAVANGVLLGVTRHGPSAPFPHGSTTWHWSSGAPVASYLVEDSVGNYRLTWRTVGGIRYYQGQDTAIPIAQQRRNTAVMDRQPGITAFESRFAGPFPFGSDGILVGTPRASFEEEMQTMITFAGGAVDTGTLYHENFHQWWGDNVSEGSYAMTFYKEGLATLAEELYAARLAEQAAGGAGSPRGRAAFQASLVRQFDQIYRQGGQFWTAAPSDPTPYGLFSGAATYARPSAAYLALRQILGPADFRHALVALQRAYGGSSVTEPELEAAFHDWLPDRRPVCQRRLTTFFTDWFDTAYPAAGGAARPRITGPGLAGPDFYQAGGCPAPR